MTSFYDLARGGIRRGCASTRKRCIYKPDMSHEQSAKRQGGRLKTSFNFSRLFIKMRHILAFGGTIKLALKRAADQG